MLILSTSGSVSMAVAPVEPSESPPTVRCSLDVERGRKGREGGRGGREEGEEGEGGRERGREGGREGGRVGGWENQLIKAAWIVPISQLTKHKKGKRQDDLSHVHLPA